MPLVWNPHFWGTKLTDSVYEASGLASQIPRAVHGHCRCVFLEQILFILRKQEALFFGCGCRSWAQDSAQVFSAWPVKFCLGSSVWMLDNNCPMIQPLQIRWFSKLRIRGLVPMPSFHETVCPHQLTITGDQSVFQCHMVPRINPHDWNSFLGLLWLFCTKQLGSSMQKVEGMVCFG